MVAFRKTGVDVSEKKRNFFSGEFKAKVALEALRGIKTVNVVPKSPAYIRRKCASGRESCKSRRLAFSRSSAGSGRWTSPPARSGCIPRSGG
jgi:hypothetical protein